MRSLQRECAAGDARNQHELNHVKELKTFALCLVVSGLALLGIAAVEKPITQTKDLKIENTNNAVGLTIQKSGTVSSNAIEIWRGGKRELAIPGTNSVAGLKQNLGLTTGRGVSTADGKVTNSFSITYSSAPKVFLQPYGTTYSGTNVVISITESNFVADSRVTGVTNDWYAIGPPSQ